MKKRQATIPWKSPFLGQRAVLPKAATSQNCDMNISDRRLNW